MGSYSIRHSSFVIRHSSRLLSLAVKRFTIYPLALRMRRKVSHAASQRAVSEPIVVAVELLNGTVGYGETLPRPYVRGNQ